MKKALIAMSGGVDSSVAAHIMKERGFECIGCTMKLFENEDAGISREKSCCSLSDVEDARSVAYRLGMPYYVFNFKESFRKNVIDRFVSSYLAGLTPNPCIDCNRYLKFAALYERAKELGCDCIVTGHYARIEEAQGGRELKKALEPMKDQSYVLHFLSQEQLAHTVFPLGGMSKDEVRALAESLGFINADKPDSQDICFVPDGDYAASIERFSGRTSLPGNFVDSEGNVLGQHRGIINYTVGQRKGLGIAAESPYYVLRLDPERNEVVLGHYEEQFSSELLAGAFSWISGSAPTEPVRCSAKIRYRHAAQPAWAYPEGAALSGGSGGPLEGHIEGQRVRIVFDEPQRAVTPGQYAVLYDGDTVLGGGVILRPPMPSTTS